MTWIRIDDRLPDVGAQVLCYLDNGSFQLAEYMGGDDPEFAWLTDECGYVGLHVTHWMPLTKPSKEAMRLSC